MRTASSSWRFLSLSQAKEYSKGRQAMLREAPCQKKGLVLDDSLHLHDLGISAFRRGPSPAPLPGGVARVPNC
jgi:hypothetical protein